MMVTWPSIQSKVSACCAEEASILVRSGECSGSATGEKVNDREEETGLVASKPKLTEYMVSDGSVRGNSTQ